MSDKPIYFIQGCELYLCKPIATPADKKDQPKNCYPYTCDEGGPGSGSVKCGFSEEPSTDLSMTVKGSEYTVFDTVYQDTITTYAGLADTAIGFLYHDDLSGSGGKVTKSLYPLDLEYYTTNIKQCGDGGIKTAKFASLPPALDKAAIAPAIVTPDDKAIPVFTFSGKPDIAQKITAWLKTQKSTTIELAKSVVIYHTAKMEKLAEKLKETYLKTGMEVALQKVPDDIYKMGDETPDPAMKKVRTETLTVAYIPTLIDDLDKTELKQIYTLYLSEAGLSDQKPSGIEFTEEETE